MKAIHLALLSALTLSTTLSAADKLPGTSAHGRSIRAKATPIVRNYGTVPYSSASLSSAAFTPWQQTNTWARDAETAGIYFTSDTGQALFLANLALPVGAKVRQLDLLGCDSTPDGELYFYIFGYAANGDMIELTENGTSGLGEMEGCSKYTLELTTPLEIESDAVYYAGVATSGNADTMLQGMRVLYQLQVSDGPQAATFTDVPTNHIFYKFVEALTASGVTAGCGGAKFCVNSPITRGEVAVWLAVALGLQFPN